MSVEDKMEVDARSVFVGNVNHVIISLSILKYQALCFIG